MKKLLFVFVVFFIGSQFNAKGQLFVGGDIGISVNGGKIKSDGIIVTDPSTTQFNITPRAGYFLSEKLAVGAGLNIAQSTTKSFAPDAKNVNTTLGISPFVRYYLVQMDKFSLFGQGTLGFGNTASKNVTGGTTTKGPSTTTISFNIVPRVAYNLSDKIVLEAGINIFNLGYSYQVQKTEAAGITTKDISTNFNLGASTNSIFTTGAITVGAIIIL